MLRLGYPVIGVEDLPRAVTFWTSALDLVAEEGGNANWRFLEHADGSGQALALMRSESAAEAHPRIHLDLLTDTPAEQEAEVERLVSLGASRVDWPLYPANPDFVVLADPDGNMFCVIDLSKTPAGQPPSAG